MKIVSIFNFFEPQKFCLQSLKPALGKILAVYSQNFAAKKL
ncbi:hypothetical protein COO91_07361 [Nostoc flagelliforme CCNUN1]|uniref:Uncharacterized protein n=1 Tax=Nostoc flagelliforme CCNUN1 TaxID=2038116 RepID=A0A2K8T132_9NOSO|nr:hypothetical protein COO91_07361 [Nostoc flagelliforme CCNUN1]